MKKAIAIYLRVSTTGQDVKSQEPDLNAWLRVHGRGRRALRYVDHFTGATLSRPAMQKLEEDIRSAKVDTLVVWRLDRLGRTAGQTISFLENLDRVGVRFVSVRDNFDSTTAAGRMVRGVLAQVAAYERELLTERIRAGIERAKSEGKTWGGKKPGQRYRVMGEKLKALRELHAAGTKKAVIARQLGISRSSVYRVLDGTTAAR